MSKVCCGTPSMRPQTEEPLLARGQGVDRVTQDVHLEEDIIAFCKARGDRVIVGNGGGLTGQLPLDWED